MNEDIVIPVSKVSRIALPLLWVLLLVILCIAMFVKGAVWQCNKLLEYQAYASDNLLHFDCKQKYKEIKPPFLPYNLPGNLSQLYIKYGIHDV